MNQTKRPMANISFLGGLELMELLILLIPLVVWGNAIFEVVAGTFKNSIDKVVWLLVVLLVPMLGIVLYYLIGRKKLAN